MKYPRKWEDITDDKYPGCSRLKIHGGWLVVSWWESSQYENLIFISDPKHQWVLES